MTLAADGDTARSWHQRPLASIGIWATISGVAGYGVGGLLAEYEDRAPAIAQTIGWIKALDVVSASAALVAFLMSVIGLWFLMMTRFSDRRLRAAFRADPDESPARMRGMLPVAGWGMVLYAPIILVFLMPAIPAVVGIAVVAVCFTAVSRLFWRGWQMSDELERAAQAEAVVATFLIVEVLGVGWAVLRHYALAPAIQPVALVTMLTVIYYCAGIAASFRRGIGR